MEYYLVSDVDHDGFLNHVNKLIEKGWKPFGSPVVFNDHDMDRTHYHQAMIHHGPIDDD
jgi:hypothetical protein